MRQRLERRRAERSPLALAAVLLATVASLPGCSGPAEWETTQRSIRERFPDVPQLSVDELEARLEGAGSEPPLLIDVRAPEEFAISQLPGAVNASGEELRALVEEAGEERDVVLYCSVGYRSSAEAEVLIERGFSRVFNLEGSIFAWANSGRAVYRGDDPVEAVHPFDEDWGRLLDARLRSYRAQP